MSLVGGPGELDALDEDHYQLPEPDGSWWVVGWDPSLGTYYAQHVVRRIDDREVVLEDYGQRAHELPTIERVREVVGHDLPDHVTTALTDDAASVPETGVLPRVPWDLQHESRLRSVTVDDEAAWSTALSVIAQRYRDRGVEPLRALPADPVRRTFEWLHEAADVPSRDPAAFATNLGMNPVLARGILGGTIRELDPVEIRQVCESLVCSPFDLWGSELARAALPIYPPERWPRRIEPLDSLRNRPVTLPEAKKILREFAEETATRDLRGTVGGAIPPANQDDLIGGAVVVTGYQQIAVAAIDAEGNTRTLNADSTPVEPEAEYHLVFRQVTDPTPLIRYYPRSDQGDVTAGWDVHPGLAAAADHLRHRVGETSSAHGAPVHVEVVRFTPGCGAEVWVIWRPDSDTWELAHDPRDLYPGSPSDVIQSSEFVDPRPYEAVDDDHDGILALPQSQGLDLDL